MLRAWRCGMLDEDMVQFSVTVTLDGKPIDDIAQAIYNSLKHELVKPEKVLARLIKSHL
jgi:hypothetical protein